MKWFMESDSSPHPVHFTFTERELISKTVVLVLAKALGDDGQSYYAYAAIKANMLPSLIEAQQRGGYDLRKFGMILEAGTGEPNEQIMQTMRERFGFNHEEAIILSEGEMP